MNDEHEPPYADPPTISGVHFLTCRTIWYDYQKPEAGFGLGGLYVSIEPPGESRFPFRLDRVFVYCQLFGDPGEYRLRVRLVCLESTEDGDLEETQLGVNGEPREFSMPAGRPAVISGIEYVDELAFPIGPVSFGKPGLYEYQLRVDGLEEPISRERVMVRGHS